MTTLKRLIRSGMTLPILICLAPPALLLGVTLGEMIAKGIL